MTDAIDQASQYEEMHRAHALAAIERQRARQTGLPHCVECGTDISPLRMSMGALLCVECQTEAETRATQMTGRGRL